MAFPGAFLDELRHKTDMIALVSQYTQPVRRGTRWFARCPFHSEKTPSFSVTPESGLFYCFGCQAGGGPIEFIMRAENLDFSDAVGFLAGRLGMAVPEGDTGYRVKRERLLEINRMAARWFYERLRGPEGEPCAGYLQSRGMKRETARRFGLGYAPRSWDALAEAMTAAGVSADELFVAGLVSRNKRGGLSGAFYDRLMFPLFDLRGQVIAFTGRALGAEAMPKYKNSAETPVFRKRDMLYGAHLARKSERPYWILAEGNVDVFTLHQAGFDNAVATCGTALTPEHARLLARHVKEVYIAYDGDAAGRNATLKAVGPLETAGMRVRVLDMRGEKDPDDFIRKYGAEGFEKQIKESQNHIEYGLSLLESKIPPDSDAAKQEFLKEAIPLLAALPTRSAREIYAARVGGRLGIDGKNVLRDVEAVRRGQEKSAKKSFEAQVLRPKAGDRVSARQAAEEQALAVLLRRPELQTSLTPEDFQTEGYRPLFENRGHPLTEETAAAYAGLMARNDELPNAEAALRDCEKRIKEPGARFSNYRTTISKEERDGS